MPADLPLVGRHPLPGGCRPALHPGKKCQTGPCHHCVASARSHHRPGGKTQHITPHHIVFRSVEGLKGEPTANKLHNIQFSSSKNTLNDTPH